ncbi:MAG: sulfatase [Planctomycetaceae bacterium]|nr:sulfatase [Planctomycetaceae bacterium]
MNELSPAIDRRAMLQQTGAGFGSLALASMLLKDSAHAALPNQGTGGVVKVLHHPPKATRIVQLFMGGAASHLDLWDYKPALEKHHGEESDFGEKVEAFQNGLGPWMKSPFKFSAYGESRKMISEAVSPLGDCVDDMAFVHNLIGKTGVHSQATYLQATGFQDPGFPGMGSWISYGLGTLNDNLPTFVVLPDHRGFASNGPKNWGAAFLPTHTQGTAIFPQRENPIEDLLPRADFVTKDSDRDGLALLNRLNRDYEQQREGDGRLEARIRSYELAAKMQLSAPEALDLSKEPEHILKMYGLDRIGQKHPAEINIPEEIEYFGRKCLITRRLVERGVRFVQIWSGNDNSFPRRNWDSHEDIVRDHQPLAYGMAVGTAALIKDLKQRGLLKDTIILWTTEFGRMPSSQGSKGRDHNPYVFTNWLCGGGIKGGTTYGPSDQWGYKPLDRENPTQVYDIHATILHLLGIDHKRLTVRHNGVDRRLTDVHGHVIKDVVA